MRKLSSGALLVLVVALVAVLVVVSPVEAGYWQLQGDTSMTFGSDGHSREWVAQGAAIKILDYSSRHVNVSESGMVGGGFNIITWRSEWSPPAQIIPGEVINVTVKATLTNLSYERPQYPWTFEVPMAQFTGLGGPIMVINGEDIKATAPGQARVTTNSTVRASAGNNAGAVIRFAIPTRYSGGVQVVVPYVWVDSVPSGRVTYEPNTYRDGSDYKRTDGIAVEACRQQCEQEERCKAFSWVIPGFITPGSVCLLKDAVPAAANNEKCSSGVKQ